jgi:squalene-hopene/tetraprenyl-beta-curcumene cyclase
MLALMLMSACTASIQAASNDPSSSQVSLGEGIAWKSAAAKYLDDRMDLWFDKAKKLRTGAIDQGKTACVSCHTTVPYALARPALRKAAEAGQPTPQEARLLNETLRRVETYGDHEPLYKGNEEPSDGTEAVLNLLVLVRGGADQNRETLKGPIHRALNELWKEQQADGKWGWLDFGNEPFESSDSSYYGAALAALAVGYATGEVGVGGDNAAALEKMRGYLKSNYQTQNLYNKTWMLLASSRLPGLLDRDEIRTLADALARQQNSDGGWSLYKLGPWTWSKAGPQNSPPEKLDVSKLSESDGYATGFVAYALSEAGWPSDDPGLRQALGWLRASQSVSWIGDHHWTCWRTYSLNCDREHGGDEGEPWRRMFMSDGATAFASLALVTAESRQRQMFPGGDDN